MPSQNRTTSLRRLTVCALFAAILCVLSPIAIPIGPIPISLGLLGVLLTAATLSPAMSFSAVAVFVALGVCGLPVFSGCGSGAMVLVGPTGGYLWCYLLAAPLVSFLCKNKFSFLRTAVACLAGTLLCYTCGTLQYMLLTDLKILPALLITVLPFLPFDILKSLLAAHLSKLLKKHLQNLIYFRSNS